MRLNFVAIIAVVLSMSSVGHAQQFFYQYSGMTGGAPSYLNEAVSGGETTIDITFDIASATTPVNVIITPAGTGRILSRLWVYGGWPRPSPELADQLRHTVPPTVAALRHGR